MTRLGAVQIIALLVAAGCTPVPVEPEPPEPIVADHGDAPVRRFAFTTLDGQLVTTASFRGRFSVVAMVATYDTASQAQTRFVRSLFHHHTPRINALLLVLERPEHRPLVEVYAASLSVDFPVAIADEATLRGDGPFTGLHTVPSVVILDRDGREVWRKTGLSETRELAAALHQFDGGPR